jgi:crotonobetainyl-CoA:carnitine CoA-transferase CaiB-like acyl-CoA transferase
MAAALKTIRVVDFGHYVAGPLAALLLADNGADVVHIDRPGEEAACSDAFYNRGKKRRTLDLKSSEGHRAARALIAEADVVIENFRPGVMKRLGLDADSVRSASDRLIYCSLPGFAPSDPRAAMPGWEGVIQAATGGYQNLAAHYYTDTSTVEVDDPDRPLFNFVPLASNLAGMLGATSIMMALLVRERAGVGQTICLPLYEAMIEALNMRVDFPQFGLASPPGTILGKYICADGRFLDLMAHPFRFIRWLIDHLGLTDEWHAAGALDPTAIAADPLLAARVHHMLADLFASRPSSEWEAISTTLRIPLALVRTPGEWLRTAPALASRSVVRLDDPILGPLTMAGLAINLDATPCEISPRRRIGSGPTAFDPRLAHAQEASERTQAVTHALDGVSVLDLTTQVAGPTVGRILADFGAEVVKINHPETDVLLAHVNRGKKTALLDLKRSDGRDIVLDLAARSDVFLQNFAMGAADRYGVGLDDVRARRPDIVYCSISTYAYTGEWGARRGFEMEGQASTGLAAHYAGRGRWPLNHPMLVNDVGTGILGAFGVAVALYHKRRSGSGQHVNVSLSQTATLHQASYLMLPDDREEIDMPGLDARGWNRLQHLYQASDGWFFLGAHERQAEALMTALGLPGLGPVGSETTAAVLAAHFISKPLGHWLTTLPAAGVGIHRVIGSSTEAAADMAYAERGIVVSETSATGETVLHPAIGPWLSLTPPQARPFVAPFGSDIEEILRSVGREGQLETLERTRTIARSGPVVIGAQV